VQLKFEGYSSETPRGKGPCRLLASDDNGKRWEALESLIRRRKLHKVVRAAPIATGVREYYTESLPVSPLSAAPYSGGGHSHAAATAAAAPPPQQQQQQQRRPQNLPNSSSGPAPDVVSRGSVGEPLSVTFGSYPSAPLVTSSATSAGSAALPVSSSVVGAVGPRRVEATPPRGPMSLAELAASAQPSRPAAAGASPQTNFEYYRHQFRVR